MYLGNALNFLGKVGSWGKQVNISRQPVTDLPLNNPFWKQVPLCTFFVCWWLHRFILSHICLFYTNYEDSVCLSYSHASSRHSLNLHSDVQPFLFGEIWECVWMELSASRVASSGISPPLSPAPHLLVIYHLFLFLKYFLFFIFKWNLQGKPTLLLTTFVM